MLLLVFHALKLVGTLYCLALIAAVFVAACQARSERPIFFQAVAVLFANWILFVGSFHGFGVWDADHALNALMLEHFGSAPGQLDDGTCWAIQDTVASLLLISTWFDRGRSWMLMLWAIQISQILCDWLYQVAGSDIFLAYQAVADATLAAQIAIIYFAGGPHVPVCVAGLLDRFRNIRNSATAAPAPARAGAHIEG